MFKSLARQILAILVFAIIVLVFWKNEGISRERETFYPYNEAWKVEVDGGSTQYQVLPDELDSLGTGKIALLRVLGDEADRMESIGFYTSHQLVNVYVGEKQVYGLYPEQMVMSKTPGNTWNFVELEPEYHGQELKIVLTGCYGAASMAVPTFHCGAKDSFILWYIQEQLPSFFISVLIFLIGAVLVVTYFCARKTMALSESVLWLGMFAIPLAVWSSMECNIFTFFSNQSVLLSQITFASLKLVLIPIMQFVSVIYEMRNDKIIKGICIANKVDFWGTGALQLVGWLDYKETLWITHITFIVSALYVLICTIRVLLEKGERSRKSRQTVAVHAICVGIVAVCVLLDVSSFYFWEAMDSARFSRMGMMIYIIVLAIQLLDNSVRLIRVGQQVNVIRAEAETDSMTKLKNRRAFEKTLQEIAQQEIWEYGIVLCDLNNLKFFNDEYGHSIGDYYIIICSEMIQDFYGRYGTVYRIGGDEFCAIVKGITPERVEELREAICRKLEDLSGVQYKQKMGIAVGYAQYDATLDRNLSDTMARADAVMYQRKRAMKKK